MQKIEKMINDLTARAKNGEDVKSELQDLLASIDVKIDEYNGEVGQLEAEIGDFYIQAESASEDSPFKPTVSLETLNQQKQEAEQKRNNYAGYRDTVCDALSMFKNFDKFKCFRNITVLLEKQNVKIGQIEKAANVRLGYMSRLNKKDNTSEPSMEFIVTAAKMLHVSVDVLLSAELSELTPTEQYIISFMDKLKEETMADHLDWHRESEDYLNRLECDINGNTQHTLFHFERFSEVGESEYPEEVERVVFNSHSFGCHTAIAGDCFHLYMKNGILVYIMNISKSVHYVDDPSAFAKEVWMVDDFHGTQYMCGNNDGTVLGELVDLLYDVIVENAKHPKIGKGFMAAIDAFVKSGDLTDDPEWIERSNLPFV